MREYLFYVYIMQSNSRRAVYTGMTNSLRRRVWQHKTHEFIGFTNDYDAGRLVYYEQFQTVQAAIRREKQIKNWTREKKLALIATMNPDWKDLAADWYGKADLKTNLPIQSFTQKIPVVQKSPHTQNNSPTQNNSVVPSEVEGPCVPRHQHERMR